MSDHPVLAPAPAAVDASSESTTPITAAAQGAWGKAAPAIASTPAASPAAATAAPPSNNSGPNVTLVIDSGAFIKGARLERMGCEFYTLPDVLGEIKDVRTRQAIEALPYQLKFREPTPESIQQVIKFAKLTGDFASLSVVDLRVLALTYTLEKEFNGSDHIRTQPVPQVTLKTGTGAVKGSTAGFFFPRSTSTTVPFAEATTVNPFSVTAFLHSPSREEYNRRMNIATTSSVASVEDAAAHPDATEGAVGHAAQTESQAHASGSEELTDGGDDNSDEGSGADGEGVDEGAEGATDDASAANVVDEDDNEGWITPDNIASANHHLNDDQVAADSWSAAVDSRRKVACVSTDFSLQNVLIQMGMHVLSVDGMLVKRARTFVFKCHACNKITKDMTRLFCGTCGNNTLRRIAISVDENGVTHYHQNRNKPINIRGTKYSIPAPKGGRNNNDLILREDQLKHANRTRGKKKGALDVFDPDYVASSSPFASAVDPRKARGSEVQVGFGKRNPNEAKRKSGRRK